jgi:HlyD family secretion protein
MNRKKNYIYWGLALLLLAAIWYFSKPPAIDQQVIKVPVKSGKFVISITTTGELEARSNEKIHGPNPSSLRNARIWQYRIEKIVPDGTVVDSGQWVANLDRSDLANKIKDQELEVEKLRMQYTKTQLDTAITLRDARNALVNMKYTLENKQIVVDQSIYEPPATQRQVKLDLQKARRTFRQSKQNYLLQTEKATADMKEVEASLNKSLRKLHELKKLSNEFVIYAPKTGMVIYKRSWDGKKQGVGAQISAWDNVVAILPDLSAMNSRTYVNEIDISKVKKGQKAVVSTDAFPNKKFTGVVTEVANMGQQMKNSNAKVFEVIIQLDGNDSVLRPAMTTKNRIITETIDSALFVPIECIHHADSVSFVYTGKHKQQVITGKSNEEDIIIRKGLKPGDEVYLYPPEGAENWRLRKLSAK